MLSSHGYAYRILHDFVNLKEGDTIIQSGPQTPVGQSIIQLSQIMGLNLINIFKPGVHGEFYSNVLKDLNANVVPPNEEAIKDACKGKKPIFAIDAFGGSVSSQLFHSLEYY